MGHLTRLSRVSNTEVRDKWTNLNGHNLNGQILIKIFDINHILPGICITIVFFILFDIKFRVDMLHMRCKNHYYKK